MLCWFFHVSVSSLQSVMSINIQIALFHGYHPYQKLDWKRIKGFHKCSRCKKRSITIDSALNKKYFVAYQSAFTAFIKHAQIQCFAYAGFWGYAMFTIWLNEYHAYFSMCLVAPSFDKTVKHKTDDIPSLLSKQKYPTFLQALCSSSKSCRQEFARP